jgi:hypothetical protein
MMKGETIIHRELTIGDTLTINDKIRVRVEPSRKGRRSVRLVIITPNNTLKVRGPEDGGTPDNFGKDAYQTNHGR